MSWFETGLDVPTPAPEEVARYTVRTMLRSVPGAVPGMLRQFINSNSWPTPCFFVLVCSHFSLDHLLVHVFASIVNEISWYGMVLTGIHFLSGGMSEEEATLNLQALQVLCWWI